MKNRKNNKKFQPKCKKLVRKSRTFFLNNLDCKRFFDTGVESGAVAAVNIRAPLYK